MGSKGQAECGGEQRRAARATLADGARRAATVARAVRLHTSARERRGGGAWRRGRGLTESSLRCAFLYKFIPYPVRPYPRREARTRGDGARARGGVKQLTHVVGPQHHARKQLAKYLLVTRSSGSLLSAEFPPLQVLAPVADARREDVCETDACGREDALRFVRCSVASLEPLGCM